MECAPVPDTHGDTPLKLHHYYGMEHVDPSDLYKQGPPAFGHDLLKYFPLDPSYTNLNHGSYGSSPYVLHKVVKDLSMKMEAVPDKFLRLDYGSQLVESREILAKLVNAHRDEIVLVPNVSVGVNTVLRNLEWEKEDIIICFNTSYNSINKTVYSLADISPHPTVSEIELRFPTTPGQIIDQFRDHLKSFLKPEGKKRVVILDSIISNPGALLPWQELVKICKDEGVLSVVDAAHSIGQEQNIDLTGAAPDFWCSNCHKWLFAKRSVAMLYIPERNRHFIKTSHPASHAYKPLEKRTLEDFIAQWEWNGTVDFTPFLTVGAALDFRQWIGGETKIFDYCHNLALEGGKRMAEIMGTHVMDPNGEFTLNMVNVELPFPGDIPPTLEVTKLFMQKMLNEKKAYSAHFYHNGRWWTRCSAQVYNEDFEKIAKIWIEVCEEVKRELEVKN